MGPRKQEPPNSEGFWKTERLGAENERQGNNLRTQKGDAVNLSCPGQITGGQGAVLTEARGDPERTPQLWRREQTWYRPPAQPQTLPQPGQALTSLEKTFLGAAIELVVCLLAGC